MSNNSLLINGLEMCGYNTNPEYHLGSGLDFGEIAPDTTTISSLFLDGDVISGERTGNRAWNLTIVVVATDRLSLATFADTLLKAVNVDTFQIVWTPDGCPSVTFDAYRATATPAKDFAKQDNDILVSEITLSFATGPFGYSATMQTISVPVTGGPTQQVVDNMNSGSFTNGTLDTSHEYTGAGCMRVTMTRHTSGSGGATKVWYTSAFAGRTITSLDLSADSAISVRLRWDQAPVASPAAFTGIATITLTDAHGASDFVSISGLTFPAGSTAYQLIRAKFPNRFGVDLTQITGWTVAVQTNPLTVGGFITSFPTTTVAYLDDLRAYPAASTGNMTGEGQVVTIPGVIGSARSAVSLELDIGGASFTDMIVHRPPVDQNPDLTILAGLGLTGGTYNVTVPAANANYNGRSYTVVALMSSAPGSARTITATFTQKIGATVIGGPTDVDLPTSSGAFLQVIGSIELPLVETPPENQSDTLTIALSSTGADVFTDVLLLDTQGQTVITRGDPPGTVAQWIDAPGPLADVGQVYGAATLDRTQAYSIRADVIALDGGPMLFDPGDNRLLVASAQGAPNVAVTYPARWLDEAVA